jgi:hypothetical protein
MADWSWTLTPLGVLAVLLLVRFAGCGSFGSSAAETETKPGTGGGGGGGGGTGAATIPDYPETIRKEKNLGTASVLISYWRLQQTSQSDPAKDETNKNPGQYKTPTAPLTDLGPERSPAAPGTLALGKPGNLGFEDSDVCIETNGGYVEVPFDASLNNLASFTLEAIVVPLWSASISAAAPGRYRSVIEFGGKQPKKTGFALYAGPEDFNNPTTGQYRWQLGIGSGNAFPRYLGPPVRFNVPNYLAVSFDGPSKKIQFWLYYEDVDIDNVKQPVINVPLVDLNNVATLPLLIGMGRSISTGSPDSRFPFHGKIQEVAIYNAALDENRIIAHISAAFKGL